MIRFDKGQTPPVEGFWSITMYDSHYFFVGQPDQPLFDQSTAQPNPDGSIDVYVQKHSPGADKESNWLPAPADKFILMLRMCWPNENDSSIINGTWTIPAVRKVS